MKKTFTKKLFTMAISLMLLVSLVSSIAISASALPESGAQDLGNEFYAKINVPGLEKTFTNDGGNVVASAAKDGDAQLWHFVKVDDSTNAYTIASKLNGGYVNVGDLDAELANVAIGEAEQQYLIYALNGKYVIAPIGIEDKVIDVNGVDFNVQYWLYNEASICQQFEIVITESLDTPDDTTSEDASEDVSVDASTDASEDASEDASADASTEESVDASTDASTEESAEESADASADASATVSEEESKASTESKAPANSSDADKDEEKSGFPVVPVVIVAVVVIAVVAVVIIKKKKA